MSLSDTVAELAKDMGMAPAECPHCGARSYQERGVFSYCPVCEFAAGSPAGGTLGDFLIQTAMQFQKPGHA